MDNKIRCILKLHHGAGPRWICGVKFGDLSHETVPLSIETVKLFTFILVLSILGIALFGIHMYVYSVHLTLYELSFNKRKNWVLVYYVWTQFITFEFLFAKSGLRSCFIIVKCIPFIKKYTVLKKTLLSSSRNTLLWCSVYWSRCCKAKKSREQQNIC